MMNARQRIFMLTVLLGALSSMALGLLAVRRQLVGSVGYWFLAWNLALAWIPLALSIVMARIGPGHRARLAVVAVAWLVFLPNAPYLLTDVVHLRNRPAVGRLDVILVVTFVLTGLLLGFTSLLVAHGVVARHVRPLGGWMVMAGIVGLCSFGISLGRIERWNSWDVLHRPRALLSDIVERVIHPGDYPVSLGITLALTAVLGIGYLFTYVLAGGPLTIERDA